MSTDTSSLLQMVHERGELARELARAFARWFKSGKVWLHTLIWLLIIVLILFFATTRLREATKTAVAAGESPPTVETVLLYGVSVGMLAAFGVIITVRGDVVAGQRSGMAARRTTTLRMQGKPEAASLWARQCGWDADREPIDPNTASVLRARMLLAQESLAQATRLLQRPLEAVETGERFEGAIEILNLQALVFQARGESIPAMAALGRALALAESGQTAPCQTQPPRQALVEPLSERELEVLELIAQGLTNSQIASRLYVSTNTIKAHTRNIYGKLGAHTRTQAVAQARVWGVLASI